MPKRVQTEAGALVTIPDDFFDPKVHKEIKGNDDESPLLWDGTYRPPTYPKTSAKKAAKKQAGTGHKANTEES